MKKEKNKYSIYGDNDQAKLESLKRVYDSGKVEYLVDLATDKVMKSRAKDLKKNRKIKDTTSNRASTLGKNEMYLDTARTDVKPTEELPKKKPEEVIKSEKPKKKSFAKKLPAILLFIITIIGFLMFFAPEIQNIISKFQGDQLVQIEPVVNPTTPEPTETPTPEPNNQVVISTGKLEEFAEGKEFTVNDSLRTANTINRAIKEYFNEYIQIASKHLNLTGQVELGNKLISLRQSSELDVATLRSYESFFEKFEGSDYVKSAVERLENFRVMLEVVSQPMDINDMVRISNEYITKENNLASLSKEQLKIYLDKIGKAYTDNGDFINYALLTEEENQELSQIQPEPIESPDLTTPTESTVPTEPTESSTESTTTPETTETTTETTETNIPTESTAAPVEIAPTDQVQDSGSVAAIVQ